MARKLLQKLVTECPCSNFAPLTLVCIAIADEKEEPLAD